MHKAIYRDVYSFLLHTQRTQKRDQNIVGSLDRHQAARKPNEES
jgi:hypothetical protein